MDRPSLLSSEHEIEELRNEVRRLREEQERQKKEFAESHSPSEAQPKEEQEPKQEQKEDEPQEAKKPHPLRTALIIAGAVVLATVAVIWWMYSRQFETTDDAIVDGHISGVSARVAGIITGVYVDENQFVKAGQVLADLDPRDYKVALAQARGQLQQAQAQKQAEQPNVPVTAVTNETNISTAASSVASAEAGISEAERNYEAAQARVREAQANSVKAQADVERYRPLVEKDEVPRQQFDQVVANAAALEASVAAARATAEAARKQVDQNREQLSQARQREEQARKTAPQQIEIRQANVAVREASAQIARAQMEQAALNLSYSKILSPVDGIVAKRTAEVGQHVMAGQQIVLITQLNDLWITANFKETQTRRMHDGQSALIHIDALDADFDGYVEGMPAATGAVTSLLPPENATGNFVKVVQRLPVRLRLKKDQAGLDRLRPGMSAEPKIRVL